MTTVLLLALFACGDKDDGSGAILDNDGGAEDDTGDTGPTIDTDCPEIDHDQIETAQPAGVAITVTATVTDESGVFLSEIYFKKETTTNWTRLNMTAAPGTSVYEVEIPASQVGSGGMDYYLHAVDQLNNECFLPLDGPDDPYHFRVNGD